MKARVTDGPDRSAIAADVPMGDPAVEVPPWAADQDRLDEAAGRRAWLAEDPAARVEPLVEERGDADRPAHGRRHHEARHEGRQEGTKPTHDEDDTEGQDAQQPAVAGGDKKRPARSS